MAPLAFFELLSRLVQFVGNQLFVWQNGLVLGGEHLVGKIVEGVVGLGDSLLGVRISPTGGFLQGFAEC
jgi:hypothetical protein